MNWPAFMVGFAAGGLFVVIVFMLISTWRCQVTSPGWLLLQVLYRLWSCALRLVAWVLRVLEKIGGG